jgi:hypothetical protein
VIPNNFAVVVAELKGIANLWQLMEDIERFNRVLGEASDRVQLNELRRKLTAEEVLIAIEYLTKLIGSRPKSPAVACKVVSIEKELEHLRKSPSELLQEDLEPLPNENLRYAV